MQFKNRKCSVRAPVLDPCDEAANCQKWHGYGQHDRPRLVLARSTVRSYCVHLRWNPLRSHDQTFDSVLRARQGVAPRRPDGHQSLVTGDQHETTAHMGAVASFERDEQCQPLLVTDASGDVSKTVDVLG
jgi:hypothetical protein